MLCYTAPFLKGNIVNVEEKAANGTLTSGEEQQQSKGGESRDRRWWTEVDGDDPK